MRKVATVTVRKDDPDAQEAVVDALKSGKVLVLPADTIYGLSAAVGKETDDRIREIKGRPGNKPFLQLGTLPIVERLCEVPSEVKAAWPCPLTCVLKNRDGSGTTAFRVPADPWLRDVIEKVGRPIYSTSVNRSGKPALTDIESIAKSYASLVDMIVVSGSRQGNVPSTLIDCTVRPFKVLRQGAYDASALLKG